MFQTESSFGSDHNKAPDEVTHPHLSQFSRALGLRLRHLTSGHWVGVPCETPHRNIR
jgi:hypothetical protein